MKKVYRFISIVMLVPIIGAPFLQPMNFKVERKIIEKKPYDKNRNSTTNSPDQIIQHSAFAHLTVENGIAYIEAEFEHPFSNEEDVRLDWMLYGWNQGWHTKELLSGSVGITSTYQMAISTTRVVDLFDYYLLAGFNKLKDDNGDWKPIIRSESRYSRVAPYNGIGERTGEVTSDRAVLHTYLTENPARQATEPDSLMVSPMAGEARFLVFSDRDLSHMIASSDYFYVDDYLQTGSYWTRSNYNLKWTVTGLEPGTQYYYVVETVSSDGLDHRSAQNVNSFLTAFDVGDTRPISFVVAHCLDIYNTEYSDPSKSSELGLKTFASILSYDFIVPTFIIMTGDTVYYDGGIGFYSPDIGKLNYSKYEKRWLFWYAQYQFGNFLDFFQVVPGYWLVDDHDYWQNNINTRMPDGWQIFRNVNPTPGPTGISSQTAKNYYIDNLFGTSNGDGVEFWRSIQWGKHLEIFLEEGRHHRDFDKGLIWGIDQREWLEERINSSTATFKILIASTPLLGPIPPDNFDPTVIPDKHASDQFHAETDLFLTNIKDVENFYIIAGDRHYKYHSISQDGYFPRSSCFNEFCSGSAAGPPHAEFGLYYQSDRAKLVYSDGFNGPGPSAGYLRVEVEPHDDQPRIIFKLIRVTPEIDNDVVYQRTFPEVPISNYLPVVITSQSE